MSPAPTNPLDLRRVGRWQKAITTSWQRQVSAVLATGRLLIRSHDDLINVHGAWSEMVANDLPFSRSTATKLMAIARNPVLSRGAYVDRLPASWGTLYELSQIENARLEQLITSGEVNSRTEREDVARLMQTGQLPEWDYSRELETAINSVRNAITRLFRLIDELRASEVLTEDQTAMVRTALDEFIATMEEFSRDVERRTQGRDDANGQGAVILRLLPPPDET